MTMVLASPAGALVDPKLGSKENKKEAAKEHLKNYAAGMGAALGIGATTVGLTALSTDTVSRSLAENACGLRNTLGDKSLKYKAAELLANASQKINQFAKDVSDKVANNGMFRTAKDMLKDMVTENKGALKKAAVFVIPAAIISSAVFALWTMKAGKIDGKYEEKAEQEKKYTTQA